MIRHQIARILGAIADRIDPVEPVTPAVEIQYVYVYSAPPAVVQPTPYWQSPWISSSPNTCIN